MFRLPVLTALVMIPATAFADTQLERFEAIAEDMNTVMIDMMINEIESQGGSGDALRELGTMMPPWTPEIRAAAGCILDAYNDEVGRGEVNAMLDNMEEKMPSLSSMTMTEAEEDGTLEGLSPAGISLERTMEINSDCGMMELQMEAGAASGFMDAMMEAGSTIPGNN